MGSLRKDDEMEIYNEQKRKEFEKANKELGATLFSLREKIKDIPLTDESTAKILEDVRAQIYLCMNNLSNPYTGEKLIDEVKCGGVPCVERDVCEIGDDKDADL